MKNRKAQKIRTGADRAKIILAGAAVFLTAAGFSKPGRTAERAKSMDGADSETILDSYFPVFMDEPNFVRVAGGTFRSFSSAANPHDETPHSETVGEFYVSKYEVPLGLFVEVMGYNPCSHSDYSRPVENIDGFEAIEFCNRLSEASGLKKVYSLADGTWTADFSADGWRLPTLPEWEYAARGGAKSRGFSYSGGNDVNEVGWFDGNSGGMSHAVGQKKPNELGLYDMSGNVGERCWDCGYTGENPAHVGRGGCWMYYEGFCEPEYRFITTGRWKAEGLGLRLFRSANEQCEMTERLAKMIAAETGAVVAGGDRR